MAAKAPFCRPLLHPTADPLEPLHTSRHVRAVQANPPEWDVFGADAHQRHHPNTGASLESKVRGLLMDAHIAAVSMHSHSLWSAR